MKHTKILLSSLSLCGLVLCSLQPAYAIIPGVRLGVNAGATRMATLDTSNIVFPDGVTETMTKTNDKDNKFIGSVTVAYDFVVTPDASDPNAPYWVRDITLGVGLYHLQADRNGQVQSEAPIGDVSYDENIKSNSLMAETEWNFHPLWPKIVPFVQGGVGVVKNEVNYKQKRPAGAPTIGLLNLGTNDQYDFAWEAGGGIKVPFNNHFEVSARYLYSGLGSPETNKTSKSNGLELAKPISTDLRAQSVMLGFSVLFG